MPRGPKGERRPADPMQRAVMIGRIATGQIKDKLPGPQRRGGLARAEKNTGSHTVGVEGRSRGPGGGSAPVTKKTMAGVEPATT